VKILAEKLREIEGGGLGFQVVGIARAHPARVGREPIRALLAAQPEALGLILDLAADDAGPNLLGGRFGDR
jgi:hypothetical protein